MSMTVEQLMTTPVHVIPPAAQFKEIVTVLQRHHISGLPVVDANGRILGVVSEGDLLVKEEGPPIAGMFETKGRRDVRAKAQALRAAQLMTSPALTVRPDVSVVHAARLMRERRVKRLPVVDEVGYVLGIITRSDLLRIYLRDDDAIRQEVVGTIARLWPDRSHVEVSVRAGQIALAGVVEHKSNIAIVCELASRVSGVVGVDCQLRFRVDDTIRRLKLPEPWPSYGLTGRPPGD